jgi:hypothetical protein
VFQSSCGIGRIEETAVWLLYLRNKGFYQKKATHFVKPGDFKSIFKGGKLLPGSKILTPVSLCCEI